MLTFIIIVSVACIGFFVWTGIDQKRQKEKVIGSSKRVKLRKT